MNALAPVSAIICCFLLFASKAQFQDDFSDNNLSLNPNWDGEITKFEVLNNQLWLNAPPERAEAHLYTTSKVNDSLTFSCDLFFGFNPSSANFAEIHLLADSTFLADGLWLLVGNAQDAVILSQRINGADSTLIEFENILTSDTIALRILVDGTQDRLNLKLLDLSTGMQLAQEVISYRIPVESRFFSLRCHYTNTRSNKFYFDNFQLSGRIRPVKRKIQEAKFIDPNRVLLVLNKALSEPNDLSSHFTVNNIACDSISILDKELIGYWKEPFENKSTHELVFIDHTSIEGFTRPLALNFGLSPQSGQLVVTELMVDPSPSYGLPEVEFIELLNVHIHPLNLKGVWINGKEISDDYVLLANELLVISREAIPGVDNNLIIPSIPKYWLPNERGEVHIENASFESIYRLQYHQDWHSNSAKMDGGVSLELKHHISQCYNHPRLWKSSAQILGGSPGLYLPEELSWESPELLWIHDRTNGAELNFNNPINSLTWNADAADSPWITTKNSVFIPEDAELKYVETMDCLGQVIQVEIPNMEPCSQSENSLVLNEIMYKTAGETSEYLEMVNVGSCPCNLSDYSLKIGDKDPSIIDTAQRLLLPGAYAVLTKDRSGLGLFKNRNDNAVIVNEYISLPDAGAKVSLLSSSNMDIDAIAYHDDLHFGGYHSTYNIALERTQEHQKAPWTSASEILGGSPGLQNTQYMHLSTSGNFDISSDLITPNGDGHLDYCTLSFERLDASSMVSAYIYDGVGNKIKDLAHEVYSGKDAYFQWKGENRYGVPVATGIYLVVAKISSTRGERVFKKSVTVLYP